MIVQILNLLLLKKIKEDEFYSLSEEENSERDSDAEQDENLQEEQPQPSKIKTNTDIFLRSDLNSNVINLEEKLNRLSKLSKGLSKYINYSNQTEVEKLSKSNEKIMNSYTELISNIESIKNIDRSFQSKIYSIINKIYNELNKITTALKGYTYTFMEGGNMHTNHI